MNAVICLVVLCLSIEQVILTLTSSILLVALCTALFFLSLFFSVIIVIIIYGAAIMCGDVILEDQTAAILLFASAPALYLSDIPKIIDGEVNLLCIFIGKSVYRILSCVSVISTFLFFFLALQSQFNGGFMCFNLHHLQ